MRVVTVLFFSVLFTISPAFAKEKPKVPYSDTIGWKLCQNKEKFDCVIVKETGAKKKIAETWEDLFPNTATRELIQKLNRLNIVLKKGMFIAVPKNHDGKKLMDFSPFPDWIIAPEEKILIFDPAILAWAAYSPQGKLLRWGPAIGGMDRCLDTWRRCRTIVGDDLGVTMKGNEKTRSHTYPIGCPKKEPCAPTPWFVGFYRRLPPHILKKYGRLYGFHASEKMVGKHASHGCVRLFLDDAKWINQNFAEKGTKVIIKKYPYPNRS